ncbi:MAG: hypothetical protein KAY01_00520 [Alicycliphilus sp.]|nr:hypothetical protein [Alicycliphilus sp.]
MNWHGTSTQAPLILLTESLAEPGGSGGTQDAGLLNLGLARPRHTAASEPPEDACPALLRRRAVRRA